MKILIMKKNYTYKSLQLYIKAGFFLFCLSSCNSGCPPPTDSNVLTVDCSLCNDTNNLNISILLDLSDRIDTNKYNDPTMQFYLRDINNINTVMDAFTNNILCKKTILVNDKIAVYIEPNPPVKTTNETLKKTSKHFDKNNASKDSILLFKTDFMKNINKIYSDGFKTTTFIGADIHKFIINNSNSKCYQNKYKNILIIFTDGYLYYKGSTIKSGNRYNSLIPESSSKLGLDKSNWKTIFDAGDYGFMTNDVKLQDFKIIVVGLNKYNGGPNELDFLKENWEKFLTELGVPAANQLILEQELPVLSVGQIENFIHN